MKIPSSFVGTSVVLIAAIAMASTAPWARLQAAQEVSARMRVVTRVPKPPTLAVGANGAVLVYELYVTNTGPQPWTIQKIEVLTGASNGRVLHTLLPDEIDTTIARPGTTLAGADRRVLGGAGWAVIYLWVPVDRDAPPAAVFHRLTLETKIDSGTEIRDLLGPPGQVVREFASIGPPLRGGPWRVGNGPSNLTGHRRWLSVLDGNLTGSERFAIDYVKLGDDNFVFSGDRSLNESHHAYGAEALAVADAVVVNVKDGLPPRTPFLRPPPTGDAPGNYIILDIGRAKYAVYAHLQAGSIRVNTGQSVRRGQVIALVGNSGNSLGPHLHFQLQDAPGFSAEGLPYVHESFEVIGSCSGPAQCVRAAPVVHRSELPLDGMIVLFAR